MPFYRAYERRLFAVQWVPENADAIIADLIRIGNRHADNVEVNGFNLIVWDGNVNLSVTPGQWVVIFCDRPLIVEADAMESYFDMENPFPIG